MMINITTPKTIPYFQILFRTMKYYHLRRLTDVVEDNSQRYYIFLRKKRIQIKIIKSSNKTTEEIQNYLNYTFKNSYLGIQENCFDILDLKQVRKIKL